MGNVLKHRTQQRYENTVYWILTELSEHLLSFPPDINSEDGRHCSVTIAMKNATNKWINYLSKLAFAETSGLTSFKTSSYSYTETTFKKFQKKHLSSSLTMVEGSEIRENFDWWISMMNSCSETQVTSSTIPRRQLQLSAHFVQKKKHFIKSHVENNTFKQ